MDLNLGVFQEPRGVMRILHLVFAFFAFIITISFTGSIQFQCSDTYTYTYEYPFKLTLTEHPVVPFDNTTNCQHQNVSIIGDFSSDARFFVSTGVLAALYAIAIIFVYTKFDELYKRNDNVPLIDFILTVIFAVLWLSSSAAWANGLSGLKHVTEPENIQWAIGKEACKCPITTTRFATLNISVVLAFLNFFLWTADLWFLYKETAWFENFDRSGATGV